MGLEPKQCPIPYRMSICGISSLPGFARERVTHLLSVDRPGQPTATPDWFVGQHLHIIFDDVESEAEAVKYHATIPTIEEVAKALAFGQQVLNDSRTVSAHLLLHCTQGASRSPAIAFGVLAMLLGAGQETTALRHVIKIQPYAVPNRLVVRLADQSLNRGGRLSRSLDQLWAQFADYRPILLARKPPQQRPEPDHPASGGQASI